MTIRAMPRALRFFMGAAIALAALSMAACGDDGASSEPSTTEEALATAEEASEAVADLEERADDLADDIDRMETERRALANKFERIHKDLRDSIANLRASVGDVESDASSARGSAEDALAEVRSALERLSVLENRLDYHLRNDH